MSHSFRLTSFYEHRDLIVTYYMYTVWSAHFEVVNLAKEKEGKDIPTYSERVAWSKRVDNLYIRLLRYQLYQSGY